MHYFWITLGIAILHRLLTIGIAFLGFLIGMTAFDGNSNAAELGLPIMGIAGILDLPVILCSQIGFWIQHGKLPIIEHWSMLGLSALRFTFPQAVWSLCVGLFGAFTLYRYEIAKYGAQPPVYWK